LSPRCGTLGFESALWKKAGNCRTRLVYSAPPSAGWGRYGLDRTWLFSSRGYRGLGHAVLLGDGRSSGI
jgi:hypothetical protein